MSGKVCMMDVGGKPDSDREAIARGTVRMKAQTFKMLKAGTLPKGDVLAAAQVAGIMAAKQTPALLPLCHPLLLSEIRVEFNLNDKNRAVDITATVKNTGKTGVEMEALVAVAISALTIYDMCKGVDPQIRIEGIRLASKSGGKSGHVIFEK